MTTRHHIQHMIDYNVLGLGDPDALFNQDEFDEDEFIDDTQVTEFYVNPDAMCECGGEIQGEVHDGLGWCVDCKELVSVVYPLEEE